jgi:hypothetical protein
MLFIPGLERGDNPGTITGQKKSTLKALADRVGERFQR